MSDLRYCDTDTKMASFHHNAVAVFGCVILYALALIFLDDVAYILCSCKFFVSGKISAR